MGGISGIAMILGLITKYDASWMMFALNIPVFIWGYFKLGKQFIFLSVFSVLTTSIAMNFLPKEAISDDVIISTIFGGALVGLSTGVIIRFSGSTGGTDIIALILTKKRDFPLGILMFSMNAVVILISGFLFGWEITLYTLLMMFLSSKVIDTIHTNQMKLTLMIITEKGEELRERILQNRIRGVTILQGEGAYTRTGKTVMYSVITKYELTDTKKLIKEVDPNAFVNITQTVEIMGNFTR